ncbi:MAG: hypothetical protein QM747_19220 [Nocardioides sp.]
MPLLQDPLRPGDRRLLRDAVLKAASDPPGRVVSTVQVGRLGGAASTIVDDRTWDHGLRTDIVGAALRAHGDPGWVWVKRSGPLDLQDVDAAWLGPAVAAAGEREVDLTFVVVTRHGWIDPRSGLRREWKRVRRRG